MKITLANMNTGQTGEILRVQAKGDIRRRLLDMGFLKNARFKVIRTAPLGDPVEILINGAHISLRKKEAETILIHFIEEHS